MTRKPPTQQELAALPTRWVVAVIIIAALGTLVWAAVFPPLAIPFILIGVIYGKTYHLIRTARRNTQNPGDPR